MAEEGKGSSMTGLSEAEAKEFNGYFMSSFMLFVAIAVVAHILVWIWKPWFASWV